MAFVRRLAVSVLLALPLLANAGPGTPDAGFGIDGRHTVDRDPATMDLLAALGPAPGGGYLALAATEVSGNGVPVQVFRIADTGVARSEGPNTGSGFIDAGAVAPDGRVLRARQRFAGPLAGVMLSRMLPDGSADLAFGGGDGWIELYVDGLDLRATALWVGADGGIVVGGGAWTDGEDNAAAKDSFVAVLQADGSLDTTFGTGGMAFYPQSATGEELYAVLRDRDGHVLFCGSALIGGDNAATLVRFAADGTPDPGFGLLGFVTIDTPMAADDSCRALAQDPDGGALHIATHRRFGNPTQQARRVYRIEDDGSYTATPPEFMTGAAAGAGDTRLAIDDAGRVLVAGTAAANGVPTLYVTRLTPALAPDTAFAANGSQRYPFTWDGIEEASAVVALFVDRGRIVIGTQYRDASGPSLWSVLRLQGDALFRDGFE